jgi:hypothetical protein
MAQLIINPNILPGHPFVANPSGSDGTYGIANNNVDAAAISFPIAPTIPHTGVTFTTRSSPTPGLATLVWNSINVADLAHAAPVAVQMWSVDGSGNETSLSVTPTSSSTTASSVTQNYSWGSIVTTYAAVGDDLNITVVINNTTVNTLYRYWLFSAAFTFPVQPTDTSNTFAFTIDGPGTSFKAYSTGAIEILDVGPDFSVQLGSGFWQATSPAATKFFVMIYVDPTQNGPNNNWPATTRNVGPNSSQTINLSLRFATTGTYHQQLSQDVLTNYITQFPQIITKPALQPMARLSFTGRFRPYFSTNPRGWFNSPNVNVFTPQGIMNFQSGLLSGANSAVTEMERLGVAGGIIWDIDGQQTDVSYLGDPPDFETISPELVGVLDTFIGRFIAAGFPVGFTLRPQQTTISQGFLSNVGTAVTWVSGTQFDPSWAGDPSVVEGAASLAFGVNTHIIATWNSATSMTLNSAPAQNFVNVPFVAAQQLNNGDPHGVLKAKIQYCINRWGAQWMRYFYVDSNLDFKGNLTPASVFQQLTQDFPGIIFAPEWKNPQHYAYTHPWIDMQNGNFMPAFISEVTYQKATGMVRTPTDGASSNPTVQAQILNAILAGNTMLCDAWFRHTANDVILAAYQQAATIIPPTPPPVPPTPPGGGPTPVNGPKHVANYSYAVLGS